MEIIHNNQDVVELNSLGIKSYPASKKYDV